MSQLGHCNYNSQDKVKALLISESSGQSSCPQHFSIILCSSLQLGRPLPRPQRFLEQNLTEWGPGTKMAFQDESAFTSEIRIPTCPSQHIPCEQRHWKRWAFKRPSKNNCTRHPTKIIYHVSTVHKHTFVWTLLHRNKVVSFADPF